MPTTTTHIAPYHASAGPQLYLAMELSLEHWKLGFAAHGQSRVRRRTIAARDLEALGREIEAARRAFGLASSGPMVSCYEAGRDGFWIHRDLQSRGIRNLVVDPGSIERSARRRRAKTDRIDLDKLLSSLIRHEAGEPKVWQVVSVPRIEDEDGRHLHRDLVALKRERTRHRNRIKGWLIGQGLHLKPWPRNLRAWLEEQRLWNGARLPRGLRARLEREQERLELVQRQIRALEGEQHRQLETARGRGLRQMHQLLELRGIGTQGAWILVRELFGWRVFANRREVAAAAGLVPVPHQSGEEDRDQGISHEGNAYVRSIAVQLAWIWLRVQPRSELTRWYQRRFGGGSRRVRKIGIVALARKLLIALWRWVELGVVPDGATLKV